MHWSDLIQASQELSFRKGQVLFYEGHIPYGLFVITSGRVDFSSTDRTTSFEEQSWKSPQGLVVGIDAALNGEPSCYTVVAAEDCKTLFLPKSALTTHLKMDLFEPHTCQSESSSPPNRH